MKYAEVYDRPKASKEVSPDKETCLISISTPGGNYDDLPINTQGWHDVLEIEFDDVERDTQYYKTLTYNHAQEILKFLYKNREKDFIIHCDAGISRSVAVALFLKDYFGHETLFFGGAKNYDHHNQTVYGRMKALHVRARQSLDNELRF